MKKVTKEVTDSVRILCSTRGHFYRDAMQTPQSRVYTESEEGKLREPGGRVLWRGL